jgi:hypothetical protein
MRKYLQDKVIPNFNDATFINYVNHELAGDFAFHLARHIAGLCALIPASDTGLTKKLIRYEVRFRPTYSTQWKEIPCETGRGALFLCEWFLNIDIPAHVFEISTIEKEVPCK